MEDISKKIIFSKDEYIRKDIKWIGIEGKKGIFILINNQYSSRGKIPGNLPGVRFDSQYKVLNLYYLYDDKGSVSTFAFEKELKELAMFDIEKIIQDKILYRTTIFSASLDIFERITSEKKQVSLIKNDAIFKLKIDKRELKSLVNYTYYIINRQKGDILKWKQSLPK